MTKLMVVPFEGQIYFTGLFQSSDSKITATGSKDGEIKIATPDIKQDDALKEQAANFVNTENALSSNCLSQRNDIQDKFVVTGNGGLAATPMDASIAYELLRAYSVNNSAANISVPNVTAWKPGNPIIEATQLVRTPNHKLILQNVAPVVYNVVQAQICNL